MTIVIKKIIGGQWQLPPGGVNFGSVKERNEMKMKE